MRLFLRPFTLDDAGDVFEYASNPAVLEQTTATPPRELKETIPYVQSLIDAEPGEYAWAITVPPDNRVVGAIELDTGHDGIGAVHYALAQEYWGQGLMTEACRAVIDWSFREHPALTAVETNAMETNKGSRRVLEKSGFSFTGIREDHWNKFEHPVRVAVYTLSRDQWERDAGNL